MKCENCGVLGFDPLPEESPGSVVVCEGCVYAMCGGRISKEQLEEITGHHKAGTLTLEALRNVFKSHN